MLALEVLAGNGGAPLGRLVRPVKGAPITLIGAVLAPWLTALALPGLLVATAKEDGPVEVAGALLYLLAAGGFAVMASLGKPRRIRTMLVPIALAGVFFLAAGEEVSWGQRVFGWETPTAIADSNVQEETTLHNLSLFDCHIGCSGTLIHRDANGNLVIDLQRLFTLGVLGLLVVPPILSAASGRARGLASSLAIPVGTVPLAALAVGVLVLSRVALATFAHEDGWAARELMETHWALLVAVLAWTVVRHHRRVGAEGIPSGSIRPVARPTG